jgi:hypothetical protein
MFSDMLCKRDKRDEEVLPGSLYSYLACAASGCFKADMPIHRSVACLYLLSLRSSGCGEQRAPFIVTGLYSTLGPSAFSPLLPSSDCKSAYAV